MYTHDELSAKKRFFLAEKAVRKIKVPCLKNTKINTVQKPHDYNIGITVALVRIL